MNIIELKIHGAKIISTPPFADMRGAFEVFWEYQDMAAMGLSFVPISAYHSYNEKAGTLRGLHFQDAPHAQAKMVSCVRGVVFDVLVDLRQNSPTYLKWQAVELCEGSGQTLYIPPGCAHGFLTRQDHSTVAYLIEGDYYPGSAGTLRWDDPNIGISWPSNEPILSERDKNAPDYQP